MNRRTALPWWHVEDGAAQVGAFLRPPIQPGYALVAIVNRHLDEAIAGLDGGRRYQIRNRRRRRYVRRHRGLAVDV